MAHISSVYIQLKSIQQIKISASAFGCTYKSQRNLATVYEMANQVLKQLLTKAKKMPTISERALITNKFKVEITTSTTNKKNYN